MRSGTIFKAFDITELRFGAIPFEWFKTKIKKLHFDISHVNVYYVLLWVLDPTALLV